MPTRLAQLVDIDHDVQQAIAAHLPDFELVLHDLAREDFETLRTANLPAHRRLGTARELARRGEYVTAAEKIAQQVAQHERDRALDWRRELVAKLLERRFGSVREER